MYNLVIQTADKQFVRAISVVLSNRKVEQTANHATAGNEDFILFIGGRQGLYYTVPPKGLPNNDVERLYKAAQALMN